MLRVQVVASLPNVAAVVSGSRAGGEPAAELGLLDCGALHLAVTGSCRAR